MSQYYSPKKWHVLKLQLTKTGFLYFRMIIIIIIYFRNVQKQQLRNLFLCPLITAKQLRLNTQLHTHIYIKDVYISSIIQCEFQTYIMALAPQAMLVSRDNTKQNTYIAIKWLWIKVRWSFMDVCVFQFEGCFKAYSRLENLKNTPALTHRRETLCVWARGLQQRPSPTPQTEPNTRTAHTPMR